MPAPTDGTKTSLLTDGVTAQTTDEVMARRGAGNVRLTIAYIKTTVLSGLGIAWSAITGKPTTLVGFGITDAAASVHTHVESDTTSLVADLALKAPLASPTFTGTPAVPTAAPGTNTTQAASTAFVAAADTLHAALTTSAHGGIVASSDSRLTDSRTPTAHASTHASAGSDPVTLAQGQVTNLTADLALKAPLASPTFTGIPAAPTAAGGTSTTQLATTAFVQGAVTGGSVPDGDKGDVTVSGTGTIWTVDALPESRITNLVADLALKAPLASPTFTGTPAAPTAAPGTNTTQLATTAFAAAAAALDLKIASNLSDLANAGTARTNLGLGALATLASITASLISDASANGRSLITATDYAAMKTLLALVIGTNVQAWDADLDTLAGMGATRAGLLAALPAFVQSLLDDVDAATARATLGAGTGNGTVTSAGITQPAAGITATGGPITTSGNVTLALANDLAALEALSGTGVAQRTGTDAWAVAALVAGDIPNLAASKITSGILPIAQGGTGVSAIYQTLTDGATINWNMALGGMATITLGGARTMAAPTNLVAGSAYALKVFQDATGGRSIAWNGVFKWVGGTAPVLSTAPNAIDLITFATDGTNLYGAGLAGFA